MSERRVVVSGIRATGEMHLGNYFGVLKRFAEMSRDPELLCFFFIADYHTLTTPSAAGQLKRHRLGIARDMIAAGVDPQRAHVYFQSAVPQVCELALLIGNVVNVNALLRMPTYREKCESEETPNAGLLTYPVLMAADILGPRAHLVPVGKDQQVHLELAQSIARTLNASLGEDFFPVPDALRSEMITVPGLASAKEDGTFPKMSKSAENSIDLGDSSVVIREKIRVAPTDPQRIRRTNSGDPERCAVGQLHKVVSPIEDQEWVREGCTTAGIGCVQCKERLAANIDVELASFRERRLHLGTGETVARALERGANAVQMRFRHSVRRLRQMFCLD